MRKKLLCYFLGLMLVGLASASFALGQTRPIWPTAGPGAGSGEGFQERFQQVKRTQMGPALGVNQQTVDRLLQIEARYQPVRQRLIRESKEDFRRLQQLMGQPSPSETEVKAVLSDIKRKKKAMEDLQTRQGDEEEALLTPVQQARYLMYLKKMVQEARSVKGRGPGETAPFSPSPPRELPVSRPAR